MRFTPALRAAAISCAATFFIACGSTEPKPVATSILVSALDTLRSVGETATLVAVVRDQHQVAMPDAGITSWTSSTPSVATVDNSGVVTAVSNGVTTILAHSGSVSGGSVVVVQQRPHSIALTAPTDTLRALGITAEYSAVVKDSGGALITSPNVQWSSTDAAVVSIGATSGLASSVTNGFVYVRAQSGQAIDSVRLVVRQRTDPTKSQLSVTRPMLFVDDTVRVTVNGRDSNNQPMAFGGSSVVVSVSGGTSTLGIPGAVDRGDGRYTSDVVGTGMGSVVVVGATIDGASVTTTPPTLRVVGFTRVAVYGESLRYNMSCGLLTTNDLYCWGEWGGGGRGTGVMTESGPAATKVTGGYQWADVDVGPGGPCAITSAGKLYCWGDAGGGNLGNGATSGHYATPVAIAPDSTFISIDQGLGHGQCAITTAHTTMCWAFGTYGRNGNGADTNVTIPVRVSGGHDFVAVATAFAGSCGVTSAGEGWCWGSGFSLGTGGYGTGPDTCQSNTNCAKTPVLTNGGIVFKPMIEHDGNGVCAIAVNGKTYCWGRDPIWVPTAVPGDPGFTQIANGNYDSCGVALDGKVYCWGTNDHGRFAQPPSSDVHAVPEQVAVGHLFTQLTMSESYMCATKADGNAWCWGENNRGQLGDGTTTASQTPVRVRLFTP